MSDTIAHEDGHSSNASVQVGEWVRVRVVYHPLEGYDEHVGRVTDYDAESDTYEVALDSAADSQVYVDAAAVTNILDQPTATAGA